MFTLGEQFLMFQSIIGPSSSGLSSAKEFLTLKMKALQSFIMLGLTYQMTQPNITKTSVFSNIAARTSNRADFQLTVDNCCSAQQCKGVHPAI
jgi:hypothetical protein